MELRRIKSFDDIVAVLDEHKVAYRVDPAGATLTYTSAARGLEAGLILRWEPRLGFLHVIQPMILNVPEDRAQAVDTAIARANNAAVLPGLGFDPRDRFIYFRTTVPIDDEGLSEAQLDRLLKSVMNNAVEFVGPVREVVQGAPAAKIVERLVEQAQERRLS